MSKFREKAEAQTKQVIGQMIGDELLVREGQEQLHHAEEGSADNQDSRHGFETGMPKPHPPRAGETDQGIVRDERGQEQPMGVCRRAPSVSPGSIAAAIRPAKRHKVVPSLASVPAQSKKGATVRPPLSSKTSCCQLD